VEQISQPPKERFSGVKRAARAHGDLYDHDIVSALDVEIRAIVDKMCLRVLGDDLEPVLNGNRNGCY
jgi:hypothetical protein